VVQQGQFGQVSQELSDKVGQDGNKRPLRIKPEGHQLTWFVSIVFKGGYEINKVNDGRCKHLM
jgi:hypothetical protein